MRAKTLIIAGLCGLVVALALAAGGVAATQPVNHFHYTFSNEPSSLCGIDVVESGTVSGVFAIVGSGVALNAYHYVATSTNPLNGKTVVDRYAVLDKNTFASPIDNGDGTMSVVTKSAGNGQLTLPNGPPLVTYAGQLTGILTFDASPPYDFVSFRVLSSGGTRYDDA